MEQPQRKPIKIIKSGTVSICEYLSEVWEYRNLILVFARVDFKLQYVQTRLNIFWAFLRPLMVLLLFSFVFDRLFQIRELKYPYMLFAFTGLIVWNNFSFMVNNASGVIVANQQLVKKMYFPRIILVISKVLISLIEVGISLILLLGLILLLKYPLSAHIVFLPVFICVALIPGCAIAIWLNTLTIRYRDLNHFIPTLVGFLIWLTPVFYPVTLIPKEYYFLIYLNPLSGIIQGFRWVVLGDTFPSIWFLPSLLFSLLALIIGIFFFIRSEASMADHI